MPDDGKNLAGASTTSMDVTRAFYPLHPEWRTGIRQISHALAEQTKSGLRLDQSERRAIQDSIDWLEIALKNETRNKGASNGAR